MKKRIIELNLNVKPSLYKGVFGVSQNPLHWPTPYYTKRVGPKPLTCSKCNFVATKSEQIELHHDPTIAGGTKKNRQPAYYQTQKFKPLCANCHSLEHRTGDHLLKKCGAWRTKLPNNQKYKNPDEIFSNNCPDTYRVQKNYYLKWFLQSSQDYKCQQCNSLKWGPDKKILSLELHHKDGSHKNSLTSNLVLLCPNCHRLY